MQSRSLVSSAFCAFSKLILIGGASVAVLATAACGEDQDDPSTLGGSAGLLASQLGTTTEALPESGDAGEPLPSSGVAIKSVTASGSGCPEGSAQVTIAPDGGNFTVQLGKFVAELGSGRGSRRSACTFEIAVDAPADASYALEAYTAAGSLTLDEGVEATITRSYGFVGLDERRATKSNTMAGPASGPFSFVDRYGDDVDEVAPPCTRHGDIDLTISLALRQLIAGRSGRGGVTGFGPIEVAVRRCTP